VLIEVCSKAGWLDSIETEHVVYQTSSLAHVVRTTRNYIHPGRKVQEKPWTTTDEAAYKDFNLPGNAAAMRAPFFGDLRCLKRKTPSSAAAKDVTAAAYAIAAAAFFASVSSGVIASFNACA
jgi:hypothetical protein